MEDQFQKYGLRDTLDRIKLQSEIEREFGLDQMTLWEEMESKGYV